MIVSVKLFGPEASACGVPSVDVQIPENATSDDLLRQVAADRPELRASIGSLRLAVNHEFATPGRAIEPTDELAIIGLVSGG